MPQKNSVLISIIDSEEDVDYIVDHGKKHFEDSNKSLSLFMMTDFEYIRSFFKQIVKGEVETGYFLCKFTDAKTKEIVGFVLFSIGSPWYNNKLTAISEELTVSLKKGYGISRSVASYMAYCVNEGKADIATGASAQTSCSQQIANSYNKQIANSYNKLGYEQYPTFYLLSEQIKNYNNK